MATSGQQPTRKQQREEARERRRAAEAERLAGERRRRQLGILGAALAAAAVIVIVAIAISSSGGGSKGIQSGSQQNQTMRQVSSLLAGLPQSGTRLGNPRAPVTIHYFADLECPVCQQFTLSSLPQVVQTEVRSGRAQLQFHSLETATQDSGTFENQQVAALAAGRQNKLWNFVELFYHEQGQEGTPYVTEGYLSNLAAQVPGLNLPAWKTARGDQALAQQITADQQAAQRAGYNATPTLAISGPRGTKVLASLVPASAVSQAVQSVS